MKRLFVLKLFVCVFAVGCCLYAYLEQQNELTKMRMEIPRLGQNIKEVREENMRLQFEIERFENPKRLMELASQNEFSHLKHPLTDDIIVVPEGKRAHVDLPKESQELFFYHPSVVVGAK